MTKDPMNVSSRDTRYIDIPEAAQSLGVSEHALERWIRQGLIPYQWINDKIVFRKSRLKEWADSHNMAWTETPPLQVVASPESFSLTAAIRRGGVCAGIKGENVERVLESAMKAIQFPEEIDRRLLLKRLLERETLASTGIGNGAAVPHPRVPIKTSFSAPSIFVCFLDGAIDYNAVDGAPVFVLFLMLSPSTKTHLQMLSRLGFCLRDESFIGFLRNTPDQDSLCRRIESMEEKLGLSKKF